MRKEYKLKIRKDPLTNVTHKLHVFNSSRKRRKRPVFIRNYNRGLCMV